LADALSLLRDVLFTAVPEHSYGWAEWADFDSLATGLTNSIHSAAKAFARVAIEADDSALKRMAEFGARRPSDNALAQALGSGYT
jgi:hypothetical protein